MADMVTVEKLSVTRKADREKLAALLTASLTKAGATVTRNDDLELAYRGRAVFLNVLLAHGLSVTVGFNGDSPHTPKDTFVLSWHFKNFENLPRLTDAFPNVNTHHRRKATDVAYGFDDLQRTLLHRIEVVRNGTAFDFTALNDGRIPA